MNPDISNLLSQPWFPIVAISLLVWTLVWKGVALWRAAKDDSALWFVLILILNTLGVLEIVYVFAISPMRRKLSSRGSGSK